MWLLRGRTENLSDQWNHREVESRLEIDIFKCWSLNNSHQVSKGFEYWLSLFFSLSDASLHMFLWHSVRVMKSYRSCSSRPTQLRNFLCTSSWISAVMAISLQHEAFGRCCTQSSCISWRKQWGPVPFALLTPALVCFLLPGACLRFQIAWEVST